MTSAETWSAYLLAVALTVGGYWTRQTDHDVLRAGCTFAATLMYALWAYGFCWEWMQSHRVWKWKGK